MFPLIKSFCKIRVLTPELHPPTCSHYGLGTVLLPWGCLECLEAFLVVTMGVARKALLASYWVEAKGAADYPTA